MADLTTYRRKAGSDLGPMEVVFNTVHSANGSTVTAGWPIKSTTNQGRAFEGYFLYRPDTQEARQVKTPGGYVPSDGTLGADADFGSAITVNEEIEVWGIFDPRVVNTLVSESLKLCYTVVDLVVPAVDNQSRYDLTSVANWLKNDQYVRQASWLGPNETIDEYLDLYENRPMRGNLATVNGRVYWSGGYHSSDVDLYFRCVKRHYDHCRASGAGTFGDQSGLVAEANECSADADWVAAGTLMLAWAKYRRVLEQSTKANAKENQADAAAYFSSLTDDNFSLPQRTIRAPARPWGPMRRYGR